MEPLSVRSSIRSRIYWAFRTVNALLLALAGVGIASLWAVGYQGDQALQVGARLNTLRLEIRAAVLESRLEPDLGKRAQQLESSTKLAQEGARIAMTEPDRQVFLRLRGALLALSSAGTDPEMNAAATAWLDEAMDASAEAGQRESQMSMDKATATSKAAVVFLVGVSLAAVLASMYFGKRLAAHITDPVEHLTEVASKVSLGDLTVKVERTREDEIGHLQDSLARLVVAVKFFQAESEDAAQMRTEAAAEPPLKVRTAGGY